MMRTSPQLPSGRVKYAGDVWVSRSRGGSFLTRRPTPLRLCHAAS
jgi:hypothetical protein